MNVRGFTLVEFILYIALTSLLLVAVSATGLNILFGKAKLSAVAEVEDTSRMAMERIIKSVREAEAINSPASGGSAPALSLQMSDGSKNPTVFDATPSGTIRLKEGASLPVVLTSQSVVISNLSFDNISPLGGTGTVRIEFAASSTNPGNRQENEFGKKFYGTAHIRP